MNARSSDDKRILEIYEVAYKTREAMRDTRLSRSDLIEPTSPTQELQRDGFANRVQRITEEAQHLTQRTIEQYDFPSSHDTSGVRNILSHAYGNVDFDIICTFLETEMDDIIRSCEQYIADHDIELPQYVRLHNRRQPNSSLIGETEKSIGDRGDN